jgi:hypothetical protein
VWQRTLGWLSTASLIEWLVRVAIFLLVGGGISTAVTALGSVPVAARVIFGLGLFLLVVAAILALVEALHPKLDMRPQVNLKIEDDQTYSSQALVIVQNGRDGGGMRGTAKAVAPHVEILDPNGDLITDEVGWEDGEQRDLRPTRKQHRIYIAFKQEADRWLCGTLPGPDDRYMLGFGREFLVRVTLRGDFPRKFVREFRLSTTGESGGIDFEEVG